MRWLWFTASFVLGLAVAVLALYLVARDGLEPDVASGPRDDINDASRAKLERVLRESEAEPE